MFHTRQSRPFDATSRRQHQYDTLVTVGIQEAGAAVVGPLSLEWDRVDTGRGLEKNI